MIRPRITPEAWADLQRRAQLKGINLRRSESFGHVRVWVGSREVMNLDDLDAVINAAAPAWDNVAKRSAVRPPPVDPSAHELAERLERERADRRERGAAALQSVLGAWGLSAAGACEACGKPTTFTQGVKCLACIRDAELCAKLEKTIAATPEGITAALIERASRP